MAESDSEVDSSCSSEDSESADEVSDELFKNDGSFLERFKKLQDEKNLSIADCKSKPVPSAGPTSLPGPPNPKEAPVKPNLFINDDSKDKNSWKPPHSFVGKRRGGRILPTGVVKKQKIDNSGNTEKPKASEEKPDAWNQYMNEVQKYREHICKEDEKSRPLVK